MAVTTLAIVALAFSLDLLVGEPPNALHPVAWFGRLVAAVDRNPGGDGHTLSGDERTWSDDGRTWSDDQRERDADRRARATGLAIALVLPLVPAVAAAGAVVLATAASPLAGGIAAGVVLFLSTSLRRLLELAEDVLAATETDLERARADLRGLAGRDAADLSPAQVRSAAIESAAENLSDGLLATLLPFALLAPFSLPAAAAVAAWVKGVNTLDSMLGYPAKPIGTASARLDDAVMWLPARVTAACIAVVAGDPGALLRAREWARAPSSPNAGWPMATLAAVLDVRLEKPGAYVINPTASLPTVEAGERALTLVGLAAAVGVVLVTVLAAVAAVLAGPEPIVLASSALSLPFDPAPGVTSP